MKKSDRKKVILFSIFSGVFILSCTSGCSALESVESFFNVEDSIAKNPPFEEGVLIEEQIPTLVPTEQPIERGIITVWVPSQFDLVSESESAKIFQNHLDGFRDQNPDADIEVRVKSEIGADSLLEALQITEAAAPKALPTVVLLSRADMVEAVELGLVKPIEFFTDALEEENWYPFAVEMGRYHSDTFGLPFAASVLVMQTNRTYLTETYLELSQAFRLLGRTAYLAGENSSLLPYILYQSAGGKLVDEMKHPVLDLELFSQVLTIIDAGRKAGLFSQDILSYSTIGEITEDFSKGNLDSFFTWSIHTDFENEKTAIRHIPAIGEDPFSFADGWMWCLVQKSSIDTDINAAFLEYMVLSDFQREWTAIAGFLPVRPSSTLEFGGDQEVINQILLAAHVVPENNILEYSQELLSTAVRDVINGTKSVETSIQLLETQFREIESP